MHPVLAAGIWPGVEQGVAQRSVLPPRALALVPTAVSLWRGWVSGPECSAVGMWGWATDGSYFPMATGVEHAHYGFAGSRGWDMGKFSNCRVILRCCTSKTVPFSELKFHYLLTISPILAFTMHSSQISCSFFFFNKAWLRKCPLRQL